MKRNFLIVRHFGHTLYTFEATYSFVVLALCVLWRWRGTDAGSLPVFLTASLIHILLEWDAARKKVRVVNTVTLFGRLRVSHDVTTWILGTFEGGVASLGAYHLTRALLNGDVFSGRVAAGMGFAVFVPAIVGAVWMRKTFRTNPHVLEVTLRRAFSAPAIRAQVLFFTAAAAAILPWPALPSSWKIGLAYYYIGLVAFAAVATVPLHAAGVRYVGEENEKGLRPAPLGWQLAIMYGFNVPIEGAAYFMLNYPLFCYLGWLRLN